MKNEEVTLPVLLCALYHLCRNEFFGVDEGPATRKTMIQALGLKESSYTIFESFELQRGTWLLEKGVDDLMLTLKFSRKYSDRLGVEEGGRLRILKPYLPKPLEVGGQYPLKDLYSAAREALTSYWATAKNAPLATTRENEWSEELQSIFIGLFPGQRVPGSKIPGAHSLTDVAGIYRQEAEAIRTMAEDVIPLVLARLHKLRAEAEQNADCLERSASILDLSTV
jgi:hypothetical protein